MLFAVVVVGRPPLWVILMGFAFIIGEILSGKSNGIPVDFLIAAQPPIPCVHTQAHHSMTTLWIIRRRHILTGNYLITTVQVHSVQCQDVITALWSLMDRLCHGPSISLSSRSVTLFPGAPCVNSSMSGCPGSIEVVRFHFIDWLTIGQEGGHLPMCTGGCWSFSSLANVHIWLNISMTYPVQGSWWLWCFRINWVAKTIWSAKRKMWIVPRISFGFSNLSSYFWISPLPPPRGSSARPCLSTHLCTLRIPLEHQQQQDRIGHLCTAELIQSDSTNQCNRIVLFLIVVLVD